MLTLDYSDALREIEIVVLGNHSQHFISPAYFITPGILNTKHNELLCHQRTADLKLMKHTKLC